MNGHVPITGPESFFDQIADLRSRGGFTPGKCVAVADQSQLKFSMLLDRNLLEKYRFGESCMDLGEINTTATRGLCGSQQLRPQFSHLSIP